MRQDARTGEGAPPVRIIRSGRKTVSLEIGRDLTVVVRAPARMSEGEIRRFLREKETWLRTHLELARARLGAAGPPWTREELEAMTAQAEASIPARVARFAPAVGVDYRKVTIRAMRSRWGSCSAGGNLSFNCLLALCPPETADYVVVHELCHRKHMDHSRRFWAEVGRVLPDYPARRAWLKEHGGALVERLR